MQVLIVEPDRVHQQLYQDLMSKVGVKPRFATTASTAMTLMAPDMSLVISELLLPDMDALDLVGYMRNRSETATTPVILATSLDFESHMERAVSLGILDYWTKPLDMRLCHRQLRQFLGRTPISLVGIDDVLCRLEVSERRFLECLELLAADLELLPGKVRSLHNDPQAQRACLLSARGACASLGLNNLHQLLHRLDHCYEKGMKEAGHLLLVNIHREYQVLLGMISAIRRSWLAS